MSKAPFPLDPRLSAIVVAYKNAALIADEVLPRVPVGQMSFKYMKHTKEESFNIVDTKIGRKSRANQVDFTATEVSASTVNYALEGIVPQEDIENAPASFDPLAKEVEGIADLVALGREKRVADLLFNASNYASTNKATLSGTDQWSDTTSNPIDKILAALDAMLMRGNIAVMGNAVWSKLRVHPKIVKAVLGNSGDAGIVSRRAFADLFELEDVYVGQGWYNSAHRGQTASMGRLWGKYFGLYYRDKLANTQNRTTFGYTAQFGDKVAYRQFDGLIGLKGAEVVKAGESVVELLTANDLGYLYSAAVA